MADSPDLPAGAGEVVGRRTFSTSFRGFDQAEVRAYLAVLAEEFARLNHRIASLEADLAVARQPAERPAVDVASLTAALGEETGNVLRIAKETAEELRTRAEDGAARTLREAHEEATRIRASAESVLATRSAEAEQVAGRIKAAAEEEVARLRSHAETEAQAKIAQAVATGKDMVGQAQAARERVLADLTRRRNSALHQLEALRAGRERLLASFTGARSELDRLLDDMAQADGEARRAAESVGRSKPQEDMTSGAEQAGSPAPAEDDVGEASSEEPAPEPTPADEIFERTAGDDQRAPIPVEAASPEPPVAEDPPPVAEPAEQPVAAPAAPAPPAEAQPEPASTGEAPDATDETAEIPVVPPAEDGDATRRPAYAHDPVPSAVFTGPPVGGAPPGGRVDQLFARIRADRPAEAARRDAGSGAVAVAVEEIGAVTAAAPAPEIAAADASQPDPAADSDDLGLEAPRHDADEAYLQERDTMAEAAHATASRALKRALADDQNTTLERLRTLKSSEVADVSTVLDDEVAQVRTWIRAATAGLLDAAAAGARLGGGNPPADLAMVAALAERLAVTIIRPVRERLAEVLDAAGGDRGTTTVDRVNGVFREARSRVDRLVGDAITEAVSLGFIAAVEPGTVVRWVVEDADGPCADCDDNALAGPTTLGEPFPTGQASPPAHTGCRCVLIRTNA